MDNYEGIEFLRVPTRGVAVGDPFFEANGGVKVVKPSLLLFVLVLEMIPPIF